MNLRKLSSASVEGKVVLLRADLNVPIRDGKILDVTRLKSIFRTVKYLLERGVCQIKILAHLGRPDGVDESLSLKILVPDLEKIFDEKIGFGMQSTSRICLLENLRFSNEEEANSPDYAKGLAQLGDIFVNDAFSVSHRKHASVDAITHFLPSYAGLELEREVLYLTKILDHPNRPSVALIGGSKVSTKIQILEHLVDKVDTLILGGGMANTFLWAQGFFVANSLIEKSFKDTALSFIELCAQKNVRLVFPSDRAIVKNGIRYEIDLMSIEEGQEWVDIGEETLQSIDQELREAKTILWNGPFGIFEETWGEKGTLKIAQMIAKYTVSDVVSVAGGGETVAALHKAGVCDSLSCVSNAGGAFLEWLTGMELPGIKALEEN